MKTFEYRDIICTISSNIHYAAIDEDGEIWGFETMPYYNRDVSAWLTHWATDPEPVLLGCIDVQEEDYADESVIVIH